MFFSRVVRPRTSSISSIACLAIALPLIASPSRTNLKTASANSKNDVNVHFERAVPITFPNRTDSNSPAVWDGSTMLLFNSFGGQPRLAVGDSLASAEDPNPEGESSQYTTGAAGGRWLEGVVRDDSTGRLYGYYHEELPSFCPQATLFWPEIGAAVSDDDGQSWDDLGIVLTPRPGSVTCDTEHPVTSGGIGDFSVILDNATAPGEHYLYFIFSSYGGDLDEQGISFARMLWIDRDAPIDPESGQSRVFKWDGVDWTSSGIAGRSEAIFHDSQQVSWTSIKNNGYWGPSVHWNTDLNRFIVLMNRSEGGNYDTQGIYLTATATLEDPSSWATPKMIIDSDQSWYPQVIGDTAIQGTDKRAGARAHYFNAGKSTLDIVFSAAN